MNLFQLCEKYMENGWDREESVFAHVLIGLGLEILDKMCPDLAFECCRQEQSLSFFWKRLCKNFEMAVIGSRQDANDRMPIPFDITYVPVWLYQEEKLRFSNGIEIKKDMRLKKRLLLFQGENGTTRMCGMDDGVRAGLWLYDELCGEYVRAFQKKRMRDENASFVDFYDEQEKEKHYVLRQWNIYTYLAQCLILHDTIRKNISSLGFGYHFQKDPLLFLLLVCEALNPILAYSVPREKGDQLLSGIQYRWSRRTLIFDLPRNEPFFHTYIHQLFLVLPPLGIRVAADSLSGSVCMSFSNVLREYPFISQPL